MKYLFKMTKRTAIRNFGFSRIAIFTTFVLFCVLFSNLSYYSEVLKKTKVISDLTDNCEFRRSHNYIIDKYYDKRKQWYTSNLGSILFKNIEQDVFKHSTRQNKTFLILVWKHWNWLKSRHLEHFGQGKTKKYDPLDGCSVKNCEFSGNDSDLNEADAVVIHSQKGIFPSTKNRNLSQKWILLNDESPTNMFSLAVRKPEISGLHNVFNWTMTYRSESDIPVPYGRTLPLLEPVMISNMLEDEPATLAKLVPFWDMKQNDVLITILVSNCGVKSRSNYIEKLTKFIKVDVYGKCAKTKPYRDICPGHFKADCKPIRKYHFYLVFENSLCRQYLTEKSFYHAYSKGAIPIIMGPFVEDCEMLLPPNSYLHVDNYKTVEDLARHVTAISKDPKKLLSFHEWRVNFKVVNEHGYFGSNSYHLCRVCEAMNYNDGEVTMHDANSLNLLFDTKHACTTHTYS